ncbi:MAG: hypothetical protein HY614_00630, partial [Candidatus Rokubacteria bacterium]|nr:hypothetical protein [Candidatus Rokubacteria bacterium]
MVVDVAFDAPLPPFSYQVPDGWTLAPGQRVVAPLRGASRVGVVVALRPAGDERLKPLTRVIDATSLLTPAALALADWISNESLTSLGSTCLALLPPPTSSPGMGDGWRGERVPLAAPGDPSPGGGGAASGA